jgi:hypothetical protein
MKSFEMFFHLNFVMQELMWMISANSPCVPNPCKNRGYCEVKDTSYNCTCLEGFTGDHCESEGKLFVLSLFTLVVCFCSITYTYKLSKTVVKEIINFFIFVQHSLQVVKCDRIRLAIVLKPVSCFTERNDRSSFTLLNHR